uniref:Uncharacterized protein n=1 Tax=viral metagenome TaxID=1070528 RepID=A0A6M3KPY0_9ZZZZ
MTEEVARYEVVGPLSGDEKHLLQELEEIIERNMKGAFEWGTALMEIRGKKLYRSTHMRFEDYVRDRWDIGRRYANMLIEATQVVERLGTIVPLPLNEAQVRPLTKLNPHEQPEAWAEAVKTAPKGKVTASHVKRVVMARLCQKSIQKVRTTRDAVHKEIHDIRFKNTFHDFMQQIIEAARTGWKSVPKAEVKRHIQELLEAVK